MRKETENNITSFYDSKKIAIKLAVDFLLIRKRKNFKQTHYRQKNLQSIHKGVFNISKYSKQFEYYVVE